MIIYLFFLTTIRKAYKKSCIRKISLLNYHILSLFIKKKKNRKLIMLIKESKHIENYNIY